MKTTITTLATLSAAFALSNCAPQNNLQRDAAIGAAGGAILGGVIGNQTGGDGNGKKGAIIGGLLGGAGGAVVGDNKDKQQRGYSSY